MVSFSSFLVKKFRDSYNSRTTATQVLDLWVLTSTKGAEIRKAWFGCVSSAV